MAKEYLESGYWCCLGLLDNKHYHQRLHLQLR
jgi:hypothetical protein